MKWNKIIAMALAGTMTLSLAACGSTQNDETKDNNTDGKTTTESGDNTGKSSGNSLTVAIWDTYQEPGLTEIINDFTKETGIAAKIQVTPWDQYWTMLEAGATGGSLPDVFWMHANEVAKYAEYDMLLDLSDQISKSDKIDTAKYPQELVKLYQNSDGKQIAIPKDVDTIALWYNKTAFDEAGLAYPDDSWTWDTFKEAAKKLTKPDGSQYGTVFNPKSNQETYFNLIYDWGGKIISDDKKKSGWDDPKTIEAMQFVESLIKEGSMPDYSTIGENESLALFESGKVAMCPFGSWMLADLSANEFVKANCDVAILPKYGETRKTIYNGLGWAASASTKNAENAWKLIEYMGSEAAQKKQAELGVTMSAYEGTSEAWVQSRKDFHLQAYLDVMHKENMVFYPNSKTTVTWDDMSKKTLLKAYDGSMSMEDVCKEIATEMNKILAQE